MSNLFRNRFSAVAIVFAFTVAACCSPSEPTGSCQGPPDATTMQPAASMGAGQGTDAMGMPKPTPPCSLYYLAKNDPVPPLYTDIGSAHWYVPAGQAYFDQGLRFFYAFNSRESYRAFHEAANEAESNNVQCSACYWAQALPLGVDINESEQSPYDRKEANSVLHRAEDASPSPVDLAMIKALLDRNKDCSVPDEEQCQNIRNIAYYDGMKKVLDEFGRDDPNVITLYADSAMNLRPWRYWDKDGKPVTKTGNQFTEARTYLEKALSFRQYRQNEGPIHWYIHLMEGSWTPGVAKQYADLLAPPNPLAPNAGHLVHMPSHIYYRIGDMQDAIRANKEAIKADEAYFAKEPNLYRPDGDRYRYEYYPHNIHFLLAAAVLSGDTQDRDVDRYAEKLLESLPDNANGLDADTYRTDYYLAKLNFSKTADIRNFAKPGSFKQQPVANLAYDFTQLMADVWDGNKSKQWADKFKDDLGKIRDDARKTKENAHNPDCDPTLPLPANKDLCLAAILDDLGRARMAALDDKWDAADDAARPAIKIHEALGYYEPPVWLYPTQQTLASVLIRRAKADGVTPDDRRKYLKEAKELLQGSLNTLPGADPDVIRVGVYPGNGWAYYGLWEIANLDDRSSAADKYEAGVNLNDHWFGSRDFLSLERM